jgi:uncharacterized protein (TIGR02271 family)
LSGTGGADACTGQGYTDAGTTDYQGRSQAEGYDTSGPTTDEAMTRSEERVRAGTEAREAGRARLRKYVTTEQQQVTVPVTREEVRVERAPITDDNRDAALNGPDLSEEEHEVVLNEERPVVTTEAVPVERVRLAKDQVREEQTVDVDVRKEQIEPRPTARPARATAPTTTRADDTAGWSSPGAPAPGLLRRAGAGPHRGLAQLGEGRVDLGHLRCHGGG